MARLTEREQQQAQREQAARDRQEQAYAERLLQGEITKPETSKQFPYLASEDNAGELVWDVCKRHHEKTGQTMRWQDAAKQVDDYLNQKWRAAYDKRAHLFAPKPAPGQVPSQRPQGDPTGTRRSQPLTQGTNGHGAAPRVEDPPPNGALTMEELRARTKAKMRSAFRPRRDE